MEADIRYCFKNKKFANLYSLLHVLALVDNITTNITTTTYM